MGEKRRECGGKIEKIRGEIKKGREEGKMKVDWRGRRGEKMERRGEESR